MPGQTGKQFVNTDMTLIALEVAKNNRIKFIESIRYEIENKYKNCTPYKASIVLNVHVSSSQVTYMDDASRRLLVIQAIWRILQYTSRVLNFKSI